MAEKPLDGPTYDSVPEENARRKRQAENVTADVTTTEAPTTTTSASTEKKETTNLYKPGYSAFIYLVLTGVTTIGKTFR